MKLVTYFFASCLTLGVLLVYALYTREQFYPVILFLLSSKISFVINVNFIIATTALISKFFNYIFLGNLRDVEVEMLVDRGKYAITETCLAFTIFRNEFTYPIVGLFLLNLVVKSFHWLAKNRIDYLDQVMPTSNWVHVRIFCYIAVLMAIDGFMLYSCIQYTMDHGRSSLILFGFEFGLLCIAIINIFTRFVLLLCDQYFANGLSLKGFFVMIIDLICVGLQFVTYVCFFGLVFSHYGMPFHLLREVYMAFLSFQKKIFSFYKYLKLSRNLEQSLETPTEEDMRQAGDCLICREALASVTGCKKLSCMHVFHVDCLRAWLQHQQSCPLCRTDIDLRPQSTTTAAPAASAGGTDPNNPLTTPPGGNSGLPTGPAAAVLVQRGLIAYARRRLPPEHTLNTVPTSIDDHVASSEEAQELQHAELPLSSADHSNEPDLTASANAVSVAVTDQADAGADNKVELLRKRQEYFKQQQQQEQHTAAKPAVTSAASPATTVAPLSSTVVPPNITVAHPYTSVKPPYTTVSPKPTQAPITTNPTPPVISPFSQPASSASLQTGTDSATSHDAVSLPAFFYLKHPSVVLAQFPSVTGCISSHTSTADGIVRELNKGAVIFALSRHTDELTSDTWLHLSDGFVLESTCNTPPLQLALLGHDLRDIGTRIFYAVPFIHGSPAYQLAKSRLTGEKSALFKQVEELFPSATTGDFGHALPLMSATSHTSSSSLVVESIHGMFNRGNVQSENDGVVHSDINAHRSQVNISNQVPQVITHYHHHIHHLPDTDSPAVTQHSIFHSRSRPDAKMNEPSTSNSKNSASTNSSSSGMTHPDSPPQLKSRATTPLRGDAANGTSAVPPSTSRKEYLKQLQSHMVLMSERMVEMQQSMCHLQRLFVEAMEDKDNDDNNGAGDREDVLVQQRKKKTRVDSANQQHAQNQTPALLVVSPSPQLEPTSSSGADIGCGGTGSYAESSD